MSNFEWHPQPRQKLFMSRPEYEVLYGGAAGGGKSDALVVEALRQCDNPNYRGLLLRKTIPQARELILKSKRIYPEAFPGAEYNGTTHTWHFPSGASVSFGSMPQSTSYLNYQGLSFSFIGFDELTHFTLDEYNYLLTRNRADGDGLRVYVRSTANPGGIGHGWVKQRFISSGPAEVPQVYDIDVPDHRGNVHRLKRSRIFIPSTVFDNQILLDNNPGYLATLASLPEAQRQALLYGNWDSYEGQVFTEWRNDPAGYKTRLFTHVIDPFPIPRGWRRFRSFDYGFSKPFAVQWWAVDYEGRAYLYRQLYGCDPSRPNVGLYMEPSTLAKKIREIEDELEKGNTIYGVADPAIWDNSRGMEGTIISIFERFGVFFEKGKNARLSGKMQCHYRLKFDEFGKPMAYVFKTCVPFIRTLPNLIYSHINVEDIDTNLEDHDYDAMRYFFMMNPLAPPAPEKPVESVFDPLDLRNYN